MFLKAPSGICFLLVQPLDIGVLPAGPWRMERTGFTRASLAVRDIDDFYEELKRKGVHFKSFPQAINIGPHTGGKIVYLSTPDGILLELIDNPLTLKQS